MVNKDALVAEIRSEMEQRRSDNIHKTCPNWAAATIRHLNKVGIKAMLQAGTAWWPRMRPEQDDGVSPNIYAYVWDGSSPKSPPSRTSLQLPEMHVWCVAVETLEIVDLTTKYQPLACKQGLGLDWPGDLPPDYIWHRVDQLPKGIYYEANANAMALAYKIMRAQASF